MASETSWLEQVLIALSQSDINLLNEYNSTLTKKLHSAQKCSDEDLILLLADKRKLYRDFRAESYIPGNITEDSKKRKQVVSGFKASLYYVYHIIWTLTLKLITSSSSWPIRLSQQEFLSLLLLFGWMIVIVWLE